MKASEAKSKEWWEVAEEFYKGDGKKIGLT
jgi:hypothetical protein